MKLLHFFALIFFFSCSGLTINDLVEMSKADESKCEYVEKVDLKFNHGDERSANRDFKKAILKTGANSYLIDETIKNGNDIRIVGAAFKCKK